MATMNANITTRTYGGRVYVAHDGSPVAVMERSPFTGEYCYGRYLGYYEVNRCGYRQHHYRPAFQPTGRKSINAAAKIAAAAYQS